MHNLAECLPPPIPTASRWGIVVLTVLLGVAGTLLTRRAGGQSI